jgi:hypothetical protein
VADAGMAPIRATAPALNASPTRIERDWGRNVENITVFLL